MFELWLGVNRVFKLMGILKNCSPHRLTARQLVSKCSCTSIYTALFLRAVPGFRRKFMGTYPLFQDTLMYQSRRIVYVLGLALFLLAGPSAAQVKTANYWFNRAFQETNIDRKIEYYQKSIQLDAHDPEAHNNLGILYKKKGMYAEAIKEYEAALAISGYETPEYAYHNLGILYRDRAMYKQAIDYFKKVVQIDPRFVKAYNCMGLAYKALGQYEEAIQSFKQAIEIDPNYVQASYNLQNVWHLSEDDSVAKRQAEVLYDEGVRLLGQGQLPAAVTKFQQALKLNPQHVGAGEKLRVTQNRLECNKWCALGENFITQKQWKQASAYFDRALNYAATDEERRRIAARQREVQAELQLQTRRVEMDKLCQQGLNCLNNRDWLQAISKFTKALILDPQHKLAQEKNKLAKTCYYYEKGVAFLNAQRWQEAEEKFNDVLRIAPQHPDARKQLGIIAEHKKQTEIKQLLQKAVQAGTLDDFQTAARTYQRILSLDADQPQALAGLQDIRQQMTARKKADWSNFFSHTNQPVWWISFIIIAIAGYWVFARIIRPSQIIKHYLNYREYDKARIIYEKILESDDDRRSIYPALANIYIKLKRPDMLTHIISLCEKKIKQAESVAVPLWRITLGEVYQQQKELHNAQKEMELAYKLQPEHEEIQQKLAVLYSLILEKRPEDTQIAVKLNKLNLAKASKSKSVSLPQPKVEKQPKKQAKEDHPIDWLKECFGHPKG